MNYELKYLVNVKADELNFNIKEYRVLPQKPIQCIRLYKDKNNIEDWNEVFKNNMDLGGIKVIEEGKPIFIRIEKEEELEEYRKILESLD